MGKINPGGEKEKKSSKTGLNPISGKKEKKDKEKRLKHKLHHQQHMLKKALKQEALDEGEQDQSIAEGEIPIHPKAYSEGLKNPVDISTANSRPDGVTDSSAKSLKKLLEHFLHHLQRKDTNQFFAIPMNDQIAPGYSQVIKEPMDFSTMKIKLNANKYNTLSSFVRDFELMCNNACTYNSPDNICYKVGKKLLQQGQKLYSKENIVTMKTNSPFVKNISSAELGFDISSDEDDDDDDDDGFRTPVRNKQDKDGDLSPQEILENARAAATGAAHRLRIYTPKSRLGFLRQRKDGTTSLPILTGGSGLIHGTENERPVSLGALIGRVKLGTGSIQGFREDRRNLCKAVYPLYYGAYSSHGPCYDSTFANLTKEETELIFSTNSDDGGAQFLDSVLKFTSTCDYNTFAADRLLDMLTGNEHQKSCNYTEEEKQLRQIEEPNDKDDEMDIGECVADIDFESLKSLAEVGIDVSFIDSIQKQYKDEAEEPVENLNENAELINELKEVQLERLSAAPPSHLSQIVHPNEREMELANLIQNNLVDMAGQVRPEDVMHQESIRKILGITLIGNQPATITMDS